MPTIIKLITSNFVGVYLKEFFTQNMIDAMDVSLRECLQHSTANND